MHFDVVSNGRVILSLLATVDIYCKCFIFISIMKFRNQARLCLAIYDFEAHIMLTLCLTFQGTRLPEWEKFDYIVAAKCESVYILRDLLIYNHS